MIKFSTDEKNFIDMPYVTEQLKVSKNEITIRINVLSGEEGDYSICYSPSLEVSGYGKTKKEAQESFDLNMSVFCEDVLKLKTIQQHALLRDLGWESKKYARKQFSKAYVDENGVLQNLKNGKLQALQAVA